MRVCVCVASKQSSLSSFCGFVVWHDNEHSCVYICIYMDVYVWVSLCVRGWATKERILSPASLKQGQSVQKTFLSLFWSKDHTKSCARENLQDRKRGRRTCCGADKHVDPANVLSLMRTSNDSQRQ